MLRWPEARIVPRQQTERLSSNIRKRKSLTGDTVCALSRLCLYTSTAVFIYRGRLDDILVVYSKGGWMGGGVWFGVLPAMKQRNKLDF